MMLVMVMAALLAPGLAWDPAEGDVPWQPEEIALFELVDLVNGTFYDFMNISINATAKDIKREYKKQAMVIHPDKNPETEEQFKLLASVYNVLKDDKTRAMYHRVRLGPPPSTLHPQPPGLQNRGNAGNMFTATFKFWQPYLAG